MKDDIHNEVDAELERQYSMVQVMCVDCGNHFEQIRINEQNQVYKGTCPKCRGLQAKEHQTLVLNPNTGMPFQKST